MTPEAQRRAIAEACGITEIHREAPEGRTVELWMGMKGDNFRSVCVPDFLNDLNAMREAEKVASTIVGWMAYAEQLFKINDSAGYLAPLFHATAAQRAEAFLKAIGKWED